MRYVEMFCGAGGTSSGMREAGWECIGAADWDEGALATYAANFDHPCHKMDLSLPLDDKMCEMWKGVKEGALVASSPCTDFSTANSKRGEEAAGLTETLASHVKKLAPKWFLFENVPRAEKSSQFLSLLSSLREMGYEERHGVVCALGAGVPQKRKRLLMIACREKGKAEAAWKKFESSLCEDAPSMRSAFLEKGVEFGSDFIYIPSCDEKRRKSVFSIDGHSPTIRNYVRPFRSTYPFPPRDDTKDPNLVFAATVAHTSAIQGFPSSHVWKGSKTKVARWIGNAVPPPLAKKWGEAVSGV